MISLWPSIRLWNMPVPLLPKFFKVTTLGVRSVAIFKTGNEYWTLLKPGIFVP